MKELFTKLYWIRMLPLFCGFAGGATAHEIESYWWGLVPIFVAVIAYGIALDWYLKEKSRADR